MQRIPFLLIAAALCALSACNRGASSNAANGSGNAAAPAAAAAPADSAKPAPAANEAAPAGNGDAVNGLWGVAEEEDAASHRGIDFIAFNRTGKIVTALSLRPEEGALDPGATEDPWGANVLTQSQVPDGTRAAVHFEPDIEICRWRLRAAFADRQTRDYPAVNLCNTIRVDLR